MNVPLKILLINSPRPILILLIIILLDSNFLPILRNALHPRHMPQARPALIRLRNSTLLRRLIDLDARRPGSIPRGWRCPSAGLQVKRV
jgi:hypothetical protein